MANNANDLAENLVMCSALLLTSEFLRRIFRMCIGLMSAFDKRKWDNDTASNQKSLPATIQSYFETLVAPWFDFKFVCLWLTLLAITLLTQEKRLSFALLLPFLTVVLLYIIAHDTLMLNRSFVDNELMDGTNHIGPGLAVAWFSFIENVILDKDEGCAESLKKYKEEQSIGSGLGNSEAYRVGHFITNRPIILCPDLPSYIEKYEKSLEKESGKWCTSFAKGIVKIDQMERKRNGEREWLFSMPQCISWKYEVSGTIRDAELQVVRWEDNRFSPGITNKYLCVIDNRPLDSMRKWYHDQKDRGVTLEDLRNQYELFVETLSTLLHKEERLKEP